jgi:hypothetical protein
MNMSTDEIIDRLPKKTIQDYFNNILTREGIKTNVIDAANEEERLKKLKELEEKNKIFKKRLTNSLLIVGGGFAILWFIVYFKKKN